jgi:hypothetical protein
VTATALESVRESGRVPVLKTAPSPECQLRELKSDCPESTRRRGPSISPDLTGYP